MFVIMFLKLYTAILVCYLAEKGTHDFLIISRRYSTFRPLCPIYMILRLQLLLPTLVATVSLRKLRNVVFLFFFYMKNKITLIEARENITLQLNSSAFPIPVWPIVV